MYGTIIDVTSDTTENANIPTDAKRIISLKLHDGQYISANELDHAEL
jgi:hypothetical protein